MTTLLGGAGTDPEDDKKWSIAIVVLSACAGAGMYAMMFSLLKPIF